ncbi:MAG: hypothetical protein Q4P32_13220 [Micrococcales bacterium]|nr:hypothetical protein [Micrococcales bacterium]
MTLAKMRMSRRWTRCRSEIYLARADGLDFDVLQQLDTRQR